MQKRKTFSKEFKLEAVRLLSKGDKPAAEIAKQQNNKTKQKGSVPLNQF